MPETVLAAAGKFDKSVAYLLKWLIEREGYSARLKQRIITKMYEYKNLERNFEYPPTKLY